MRYIHVLAEGQTEVELLSTYVKARADLKCWMKELPRDYFTSMFDFYRLPTDFLGMNHSAK